MNNIDYLYIADFFSRTSIKQIIDNNIDERQFKNLKCFYFNSEEQVTIKTLFQEMYTSLVKDYRNEYIYKNTIINKVLFGIHSPSTTTALTEISIGKSRVDLVMINGKAIAYEIKTELDNFEKLDKQLLDYQKAFDHVALVISENHLGIALKRYNDTQIGIYVLRKNGSLSCQKKAYQNRKNLDVNVLFSILRKYEIEEIIIKHFGNLPIVNDFIYNRTCKEMIQTLDITVFYEDFIRIIKKRGNKDVNFLKEVPKEIKSQVYFLNLKSDEYLLLEENLNRIV